MAETFVKKIGDLLDIQADGPGAAINDSYLVQSSENGTTYKIICDDLKSLFQQSFTVPFCVGMITATSVPDDTDTFLNIATSASYSDTTHTDWIYDDAGTYKIRIPESGLYLVQTYVQFPTNSTGVRRAGIYSGIEDGTAGFPLIIEERPAVAGANVIVKTTGWAVYEAGQLLRPIAYQNSGGSLSLLSNLSSFSITKMSHIEI